MAGYAGALGTVREASAGRNALTERFSPSYMDRILNVPVIKEEERGIIRDITGRMEIHSPDSTVFLPMGKGGVYAALWELGETLDCGLYVRHEDIPVLQETIEVCNLLDINPYMLDSSDCVLLVTDEAGDLTGELDRHGIPATEIGNLTSDRKRVIINGENERYLNKPENSTNGNRGLQNG